MFITGCKLDFEVIDKSLLKSMSNDDSTIQKLTFYSSGEKSSILKCKISTRDLMKTYSYIDFALKPWIIKTLVISRGIKDLNIQDDVNCTIGNEKEALEKGFTIIPYGSKFMKLDVNIPVIKENEFKNNLNMLNESSKVYKNVFFWLYTSYSVTDINKGKTKFDNISQYILLWTAFNALYSKLYPELGDRKSVEEFAKKKYVIDYFEELFKEYLTYELLKQLSLANLTLRANINVSQDLKESLKHKNKENIALNGMLCLYAIRNAVIHGSAVKEVNLCRTAFEILNPLIKKSIFVEIKSD